MSVFWDLINPAASNKSIEIFGSRVHVSRKHSYIGSDLTKVKRWCERVFGWRKGNGLHWFCFSQPSLSLQLDCSADTERSQILMALKGSPHIDYWSDTNLLRRSNHHLNNHRGWNPTYMDLIRRQGLRRDLIGSACPPQMAWYLAGGTCTNGSDHIDRRSPWECEITWLCFLWMWMWWSMRKRTFIQAIPNSGMRVKGTR